MMPLIIMDRDGVINYNSAEYIKSPDEWLPIPGSLEAIADLNRAGFCVVVATNQSGLARGYYDLETLDRIHEKMMHELASVGGYIDEIFFCPHHPVDLCECRKPKPGLFLRIQEKYAVNLADVYFVGDSYSDIEAARVAGCKPILVLTGNGQATLDKHPELADILCFADLAEVARNMVHL